MSGFDIHCLMTFVVNFQSLFPSLPFVNRLSSLVNDAMNTLFLLILSFLKLLSQTLRCHLPRHRSTPEFRLYILQNIRHAFQIKGSIRQGRARFIVKFELSIRGMAFAIKIVLNVFLLISELMNFLFFLYIGLSFFLRYHFFVFIIYFYVFLAAAVNLQVVFVFTLLVLVLLDLDTFDFILNFLLGI